MEKNLKSAFLGLVVLLSGVWVLQSEGAQTVTLGISNVEKGLLPPEVLKRINCRVGRRTAEGFEIYNDVEVDTLSKDPKDYFFKTILPSGRTLDVSVQHVATMHAADQFAVRIFLDGEPQIRTAHVDLAIYLEFALGNERGPLYLLHCLAVFDA